MKKIVSFLLCALSLLPLLTGCSARRSVQCSGEMISKEFFVEGSQLMIKNIYLSNQDSRIVVNIYDADEKKIVLTAQQSLLTKIEPKEKLNCIVLDGGWDKKYITDSVQIDVYGYSFEKIFIQKAEGEISANSLSNNVDISLESASCFYLIDESIFNEFNLYLSGGSKFTIGNITTYESEFALSGSSTLLVDSINCDKIEAELSGDSVATIKGNTDYLDLELSGDSLIDAYDLVSKKADIELSGSSKANVNVINEMEVSASGGSVVIYYGDPIIDQSLSGGSKIVRKVD